MANMYPFGAIGLLMGSSAGSAVGNAEAASSCGKSRHDTVDVSQTAGWYETEIIITTGRSNDGLRWNSNWKLQWIK